MIDRRLPPVITWPAIAFLAVFLIYPIGITVAISFWDYQSMRGMEPAFLSKNYLKFLADPYYLGILANTVRISVTVTLLCLIIAYPLAFWITRLSGVMRALATFAALAPLMISVVIRTLGWVTILADDGAINGFLLWAGIVEQPLRLLYNEFAVILGLTEALLPFMIISLLTSLQSIPRDLFHAASIAGGGAWTIFRRVMLPLSLPGIAAGSLLVFAISVSSFVTPRILSGGSIPMIANLVVDNFLVTLNWPFGAAVGIVLVAIVLLVFAVQHWITERILGAYR